MSKRKAEEQLTPTTKLCNQCNIHINVAEFYKCPTTKDGLRGTCRHCHGKYSQNRRKTKSEEIATKLEENPDAFGTHKTCNMCKESLPRCEFHDDPSGALGKAAYCQDCKKVRNYGEELERKARAAAWFATRPCENCKEPNIKYLHAAHIDRETKYMTKNGKRVCPNKLRSRRTQEPEYDKCKSLCVECHQKETSVENGKSKDKRHVSRSAFVNAEKMRRAKCARCPKPVDPQHPECHQFDHLPGKVKVDRVSNMVARGRPLEAISAEMDKCQLLCAKCHIDVTQERRDDEWRMFVTHCAEGDECYPQLATRFNMSIEQVQDIVYKKMEKQVVMEKYHGDSWIDHIVME